MPGGISSMLRDPSCGPMENNAASHYCWYTDAEREKEGIRFNGPKFSRFQSYRKVWYIMKSHIQIRRVAKGLQLRLG